MGSKRVETGVDDLIRLLGDGSKHLIEDVSKELEIPIDILQLWIDFLVEEKMIGVEYSFTKPFIFLNKLKKKEVTTEVSSSLNQFKEEFLKSAQEKKIPEEQISIFWKQHLEGELFKLKEFFYREVEKRKLQNVEELWKQYTNKLMVL